MPSQDARLRVMFLTHYFPPEGGAPQTRLFELAQRCTAAGLAVTVVTGFPNYPTGVIPVDYRGKRSMEEKLDGVRVLRTSVYATPNRGFVRRILNHLSFALSSLTAIRPAEMLELSLYGQAARVSVVTPGMIERLAARGVPREKLFLLTNGVDTSMYKPVDPDRELAGRLGLNGHRVFLYAGTHGLAQGLDVILDAARLTT